MTEGTELWDWQFTVEILPLLLSGLAVTAQAVVLGMLLAVTLGLVWELLRRSRWRLLAWTASGCVELPRGTPLLIQLYFLYYTLPTIGISWPPMVIGVIGLGVYYASYTAEVYRAGIDAVPRGQWEAAAALNLSGWQTYRHAILPQAIPPMLPVLGNYLIAMFKDTPLLSAITVIEMLQQAKNIGNEQFRYLEPLTLAGILYLVLSLLAGLWVGHLERRHGIPT